MATLDDLRTAALALPHVVEAPHFTDTSFRVNGKIVAQETTHGTDGTPHALVRIAEGRALMLTEARPNAFDWSHWGRLRFFRVRLDAIDADELADLVHDAWTRIAPKRLHPKP